MRKINDNYYRKCGRLFIQSLKISKPMKILCSVCNEDINEKGQDNMSPNDNPICEDCYKDCKILGDYEEVREELKINMEED